MSGDSAHCCGRTHDLCTKFPGPMCAGSMQWDDPRNIRDMLLEAGYSHKTADFMLQAGERYDWTEKDEDNNAAYWATISKEPYKRRRLGLLLTYFGAD